MKTNVVSSMFFKRQKMWQFSGFDDALKKREHEFRLKMDEMNNALKAEQIKVGVYILVLLLRILFVLLVYIYI